MLGISGIIGYLLYIKYIREHDDEFTAQKAAYEEC